MLTWYGRHRSDVNFLSRVVTTTAAVCCILLSTALGFVAVILVSTNRLWGIWLGLPLLIALAIALVAFFGTAFGVIALVVVCWLLNLCVVDVAPSCVRLVSSENDALV